MQLDVKHHHAGSVTGLPSSEFPMLMSTAFDGRSPAAQASIPRGHIVQFSKKIRGILRTGAAVVAAALVATLAAAAGTGHLPGREPSTSVVAQAGGNGDTGWG
ncbi:hypothetical protein ACFVSN_05390 [Kitasatospora sp. NPDC057904]|uniref:hypothetical protein n=1 Tax=unclassified Kitasatospora TaxID=2633591 RepID=UPI0036D8B134